MPVGAVSQEHWLLQAVQHLVTPGPALDLPSGEPPPLTLSTCLLGGRTHPPGSWENRGLKPGR